MIVCPNCKGTGIETYAVVGSSSIPLSCGYCGGTGTRELTVEELKAKESLPQTLYITVLEDHFWECSKRGVINYSKTRIHDIHTLWEALDTRRIAIVKFTRGTNRLAGEDRHKRIIDNYNKSKL